MRKYPLIFFFIAFFGNYFFFRGRGVFNLFSISRKKKDEKTENLSKT